MNGRRRIVAGALLAVGCAARAPFEVRVLTPEVVVEPGGEARVEGELTNTGKTTLRFTTDAKLRTAFSCRRPIDPPGGGGLITGSAFEGGVWGGVTDVKPDPDDPLFCRSFPPSTIEVKPGASLRLVATAEVPSSCVEAPAELEVVFGAPDFSRRCPGYWYGKTKPVRPRAFVRRLEAGDATSPSASPKALRCSLSAVGTGRPSLRFELENPGPGRWRARVRPSFDLVPAADPDRGYWAPVPVAAGGDVVDLEPGGEWARTVALAGLAWAIDYSPRPESSFDAFSPGRYTASLWLEVVGGKSWELVCPTAEVEIAP